MKKILAAVLCVIIAAGALTGGFFIGRKTDILKKPNESRVKATQEEFLKSMAEGIKKRLDNGDDDESEMDDKQRAEYYKKLVNYELEEIEKYSDVKFDDDNFNTLAHRYIESLKFQLSATENYKHEYLYTGFWWGGRLARCGIITEMYEKYDLDISSDDLENYKMSLNDYIEPSYTISFDTAGADDTDEFDSEAAAKKVKAEDLGAYYDYFNNYKAVYLLENKSKYNLDVSVNVNAYDESGGIIDTETSEIYCLGPGEKYPVAVDLDDSLDRYDCSITVDESYYTSAVKDLSYKKNIAGENTIVTVTNDGKQSVSSVRVFAIFKKDGKVVGSDYAIVQTADGSLKSGATGTVKLSQYKVDYDDADIFITNV